MKKIFDKINNIIYNIYIMLNIINILQKFSFSEQESKIYIACLKLNKPSISQIAKKTGLSRTNTYFHVKKLIEKGILKESKKDKKIIISPLNPSKLKNKVEDNINSFNSIFPQLESLNKTKEELPEIEILESKEGFIKIYEEISNMPEDSEFRIIENKKARKEFKLLTMEQWEMFMSNIWKKGILTKALFSEELITSAQKSFPLKLQEIANKRLWDIKILPEETFTNVTLIFIYKNKIAFLTPDNLLTVSIVDKNITNIVTKLFDLVFESLNKKASNIFENTSI